MLRFHALFAVLLVIGMQPGLAQSVPSPDSARAQLDRAERAWLHAYHNNDRDAMAHYLADGFEITFPGGRIVSRDSVIANLNPDEAPDDEPVHYTKDRSIRLYGQTAILRGIYVNPNENRPDWRARYTDTWMWIDGHWQVVASHLSHLPEKKK